MSDNHSLSDKDFMRILLAGLMFSGPRNFSIVESFTHADALLQYDGKPCNVENKHQNDRKKYKNAKHNSRR